MTEVCSLPAQVQHLPIVPLLPTIQEQLALRTRLIVEAPPGSGKTTLVPLTLLRSEWRKEKKIVVVQPRRLAARNVALRMADLLQQEIGTQVGYRMRLEKKVSSTTEIEVVTEGVLLKTLLVDPDLHDIGAVILDEFHERSALSEIILGMLHEVTDTIRPDIRILLMSATMGDLPVKHFSEYRKVACDVPPFPVKVHYHHIAPRVRLEDETASLILSVLNRDEEGNILVFMPGSGEIIRTIRTLEERLSAAKRPLLEILPLYGELPYSEQKYALSQPKGRRRVILATNIAETSLTIPGVRIVIDSGYQKTIRIDPHTMLNALVRERIPLDAAEQRCGRAAREGPGVCYRMWSEEEHKAFRPEREPEVSRVDVSSFILAVLTWGASTYQSFSWITPPPLHASSAALRVLELLGAVTCDGTLTERGRELGRFGSDLRLAALAVAARTFTLERLGGILISFLEENGSKLFNPGNSADITYHLADIDDPTSKKREPHNAAGVHRFQESSRPRSSLLSATEWEKRIENIRVKNKEKPPRDPIEQVGILLASAYPDRIAVRRKNSGNRYQLASGIGASLPLNDPLQKHSLLAVCSLSTRDNRENADATILLAVPLSLSTVREHLPYLCTKGTFTEFDEERGALTTVIREFICDALVSEHPAENPSEAEKCAALLNFLSTDKGFRRLPFGEQTQRFLSRVMWAKRVGGLTELPEYNETFLQEEVHTWLAPFIPQSMQLRDITDHVIRDALQATISWEFNKKLTTIAPPTLVLPGGRERVLNYSDSQSPFLEATVQELLGWRETPRVGLSKVPITIELLSPARRPIQRTNDLKNFWSGSYFDIRKEYRGRYPKHEWPENPLEYVKKK